MAICLQRFPLTSVQAQIILSQNQDLTRHHKADWNAHRHSVSLDLVLPGFRELPILAKLCRGKLGGMGASDHPVYQRF